MLLRDARRPPRLVAPAEEPLLRRPGPGLLRVDAELAITCSTRRIAVRGATVSSRAICELLRPWAISTATSRSRAVSPPGAAGCEGAGATAPPIPAGGGHGSSSGSPESA